MFKPTSGLTSASALRRTASAGVSAAAPSQPAPKMTPAMRKMCDANPDLPMCKKMMGNAAK